MVAPPEVAPASPVTAARQAPHVPGRFDILGVWDAYRDPLRLLAQTQRTYGDIAMYRFAHLTYLIVCDPHAARRVLVENHRNYHKSRNYAGLKILLGEGLLTSDGDTWKRQRKLAQPAFHHERLTALVPPMVDCTRDMLARWQREYPLGRTFDVHKEMMRLTFRIVGRTLLSAELDGDAKAFGDALNIGLKWANDYAESLLRIPLWAPLEKNRRMRSAMRSIDDVVARVLAERRRLRDPPHDLLSMLMAAREDGGGMSDQALRDELLTLVLAGHETTANALTFALYLLSTHPDVRRRVEAEVQAVLGGRAPELADLPRLELTTRVIEETMRLFPPVWIVEREALDDDALNGYRVPRGATVGVATYMIQRHPRHWSNPEGFDPDRFLPESSASRPKYAYLPFGGGPRTCIGNAFAMMEMQAVLPMIVQAGRLDLEPMHRLELDPSITLRPKTGVRVRRVST
jgi:cytochrome P450